MKILSSLLFFFIFFGVSCKACTPVVTTSSDSVASANKRDSIATQLVNNLAKKSYKEATKDFGAQMKVVLTAEKLKVDWEKFLRIYGAFEKVITISSTLQNGHMLVKQRCKFGNDNANVLITFSDENRVIGLYFKP